MEDMVIENEGCLHANQRAELVRDLYLGSGQRILLSWQDDMLAELLKQKQPDIQIDVLMNGDFAAFVSEKNPDSMVKYNCIFDNGLLVQADCDGNLVRAMGMHLVPGGRLRSVFPASMDKKRVLYSMYRNNFEQAVCIADCTAGDFSFYIGEFSLFNQGIAWLQSFYSAEVRKELAYLLQRIDFAVPVPDTREKLVQLCRKNDVTEEYLSVLLQLGTVHTDRVRRKLESWGVLRKKF
ncbi:MAG: hypothetical protein IIW84_06545 [Selenomonadaceae bacterium]|nr:hypothetical protein [Selenomonadaceae bacterium]